VTSIDFAWLAGYSKLAMKLAERVEADLVPKAISKKTSTKKRAASPEASSSSSSYSRNVRGRGRGLTRTSEGDGSPTSHAAVGAAAEAAEEAALSITTTRACQLSAFSASCIFLSSS